MVGWRPSTPWDLMRSQSTGVRECIPLLFRRVTGRGPCTAMQTQASRGQRCNWPPLISINHSQTKTTGRSLGLKSIPSTLRSYIGLLKHRFLLVMSELSVGLFCGYDMTITELVVTSTVIFVNILIHFLVFEHLGPSSKQARHFDTCIKQGCSQRYAGH